MQVEVKLDVKEAVRKIGKLASQKTRAEAAVRALTACAGVAIKEAEKTTMFKDESGKMRKSLKIKDMEDMDNPHVRLRSSDKKTTLFEVGTDRIGKRPWVTEGIEKSLDAQLEAGGRELIKFVQEIAAQK